MLRAGVARRHISPFWGVELAGWGYYIQRRWRQVADELNATALVFDDDQGQAVILSLDLMVIDQIFTERVRGMIQAATGVHAESILVTCTHSHNAPAAGGLLGVGECDPLYELWAAREAATAAILAWNERVPVRIGRGATRVTGISFNRTRSHGVLDDTLTLLRVDRMSGDPLALMVNFAAHPTVITELLPWDVSRDAPGMVCDGLENLYPGTLALYLQGACGDVNFLREFTARGRTHEPATRLVDAAKLLAETSITMDNPTVSTSTAIAPIPTRRWTAEEIEMDRGEAARRIQGNKVDVDGWRDSIGRSMTNRPDDMVIRQGGDEQKAVQAMCRFHMEWTELMLKDYQTRAETLMTEVQAIRIGDLSIVANSSEFFAPFALQIRKCARVPGLMFACYANGRIGYLPDEHDILARSYAGYQSPKYCNQFPFTPESGPAMCRAMLGVIEQCRPTGGN